MGRWIAVLSLLVCGMLASTAAAATAEDYVVAGRSEMFGGTQSGLTRAYDIFEAGVNDANCPDCPADRELTFLHAVARTAMLFIDHNDIVVAESLFELGEAFGMTFDEDLFGGSAVRWPVDGNDCYPLSSEADPNEVFETLYDSVLPQVDGIVAELDAIADAPTPFVMYLAPSETGLAGDLEVDYGDVLILKGLLLAYKGLLEARSPYDLHVDVNAVVLDRYRADGLLCPGEFSDANLAALLDVADPCRPSFNGDFLEKYPYLLTMLPTPNDANDGVALLAQARQDWIDALSIYLDAVDYIASEDDPKGSDPQEDELLYIDPNAQAPLAVYHKILTTLRDSLRDGTPGTYQTATRRTYSLFDANSAPLGELVLVFDYTGFEGDTGRLTLADGNTLEVDWFGIVDTNEIGISLFARDQWLEAWFDGTVDSGRATITNGTLDFWGGRSGTMALLRGQVRHTEIEETRFDPNPLWGQTPVNPRDLLPAFANDNAIVPGTFGHGLGDDATLAGITPDFQQEDWSQRLEIPAPLYRFWSPVNRRYFYTIDTGERDKLVETYPLLWSYEGVVSQAYVTGATWALAPVYRFWSEELQGHFYTLSEAERRKLAKGYSRVWTYEGPVFYAYPEGQQPADAVPLWRFWSEELGTHFYTTDEAEKGKLIDDYGHTWTFEGVAWYVDD